MPIRARFTWTLLLPTAWAAALGLVGLRLLVLPPSATGFNVPDWMLDCGGVTLLAKAQWVFSSWVADRLFPHANPWLSGLVELFAAAGFVVGSAVIAFGLVLAR
jgi:hypothetical protein